MSEQIMATYEGEGPNVSGALNVTNVPDVAAASKNATTTAQGRTTAVAMTRRRQLRVSSESARGAVAINYGGGDQQLANCCRGLYITTSGNLAVRFADDSADVTLTGLLAGQWYPFSVAIIRQTASTAAGFILN